MNKPPTKISPTGPNYEVRNPELLPESWLATGTTHPGFEVVVDGKLPGWCIQAANPDRVLRHAMDEKGKLVTKGARPNGRLVYVLEVVRGDVRIEKKIK